MSCVNNLSNSALLRIPKSFIFHPTPFQFRKNARSASFVAKAQLGHSKCLALWRPPQLVLESAGRRWRSSNLFMTIDRGTPVVIRPESVGVAEGAGRRRERGRGRSEAGRARIVPAGRVRPSSELCPPEQVFRPRWERLDGSYVCHWCTYQEARVSAGRQAIRGHWFIQAGGVAAGRSAETMLDCNIHIAAQVPRIALRNVGCRGVVLRNGNYKVPMGQC